MILAVLDDLLFSSKMRTAAKQLGVSLTFARSSAAALEEMRKAPPSLVIFDLDNPRTEPIATITAMKQAGPLAAIHTLGFVSHVRVDLIQAARDAGIDDVLPRSAFAGQLPEILARGR
jgi:CheY-like chemotaxis protein